MTDGVLRLAALSGVALLGFGLLAALAAAAGDRWVAAASRPLSPSTRAWVVFAWAAAPAAIALALVAATLWPSLGAALGLAVDHCPAHDGHVHLCLHHLPARGPGVVGSLGLATFAVVAGAALAHGLRAARLARLARLRSAELAPGVGVLESPSAFAVSLGWLRPTVVVSTGLIERLTPAQLDVVLMHERAHAVRRDALVLTVARVVTAVHLPHVRRRILADLALACEQACDEEAARACGDRVRVAETIVAAERAAASANPSPVAGLAFGGGEVVQRVESLLAAPIDIGGTHRLRWILLAAGAALAAAARHVHHWTETFLDHLPH